MAKEQVPVGKEKKEKDVPKEKEAKEVERPIRSRGLIPFEDIERMFEDFVSQKWLRPFSWDMPSWTRLAPFESQLPKVDVIDGDDEIVVHAELPGVRKEDIDVSLTENTLTIKASTKREEEEEKGEYYRRERTTGAYSRTLTLPGSVDESKARATFTEGLLELAFPKRGGVQTSAHKGRMTDPDILPRVFIDDDRLRSLPKAFAQRAVRSLDHRR